MDIITPTIPPFIIFLIIVNVLPMKVKECQVSYVMNDETKQFTLQKASGRHLWEVNPKKHPADKFTMFNDGKKIYIHEGNLSGSRDSIVLSDYASLEQIKHWRKATSLKLKEEYKQEAVKVLRKKRSIVLSQKNGFIRPEKMTITW